MRFLDVSKKMGQSPGSLTYTGVQHHHDVKITIIDYNKDHFEEKEITADEIASYKGNGNVSWLNISGLHDPKVIEKIGKMFNIHSLVLEDILNIHHSPKLEDYEDYLFIICKMINYAQKEKGIVIEQVSFILRDNLLISFQEDGEDVFDIIRNRIRNSQGRIRTQGVDYLMYRLIDAIVDNYFVVMEKYDDKFNYVEDRILMSSRKASLDEIHLLKKELIYLRRAILPLREVIFALKDQKECRLIHDDTYPFMRDLHDHILQIIDTMENYRELSNGMLDAFLSNSSHKMNEVIKLLTMISAIFIPLTFIVGIYGMNFRPEAGPWSMPELNWAYGYPAVMVLMLVIAVSLIIYFKRKKWM